MSTASDNIFNAAAAAMEAAEPLYEASTREYIALMGRIADEALTRQMKGRELALARILAQRRNEPGTAT